MKSKSKAGITVRVNDERLNRFVKHELPEQIREVMEKAGRKSSTDAIDYTRRRYLPRYNSSAGERMVTRVGHSLDYEMLPVTDPKDVRIRIGSRGPTFRGKIGEGVHTQPDDNGGTFNIGFMLDKGRFSKMVQFKRRTGNPENPGAGVRGRQAGKAGGNGHWIPRRFKLRRIPSTGYVAVMREKMRLYYPQRTKRFLEQKFGKNTGGY